MMVSAVLRRRRTIGTVAGRRGSRHARSSRIVEAAVPDCGSCRPGSSLAVAVMAGRPSRHAATARQRWAR
jgi:hypothetical protein